MSRYGSFASVRTIFRKLRRQLPVTMVAVTAVVLVLTAALAVYSPVTPSRDTLIEFLGRLAQVQAGVLAIVFSVVILAMQLTASRYSTQLTELFVQSPEFVITFGAFIISIGYDMVLIYNVESVPLARMAQLTLVAGGLGVVTAFMLVHFIHFSFRKLTPDGIVSMFKNNITPRACVEHFDRMAEPERAEASHPLMPLYSLTVEAIHNKERFTALRALKELGDMTTQSLDFARQPADPALHERLFEPVLTEYFPIIVEAAHTADLDQLVESGLDRMAGVGSEGVGMPEDRVARFASDGFEKLIHECSDDPADHAIVEHAWGRWCSLTREMCTGASPRSVHHVFSGFEQELNQLEEPDFTRRILQGILSQVLTTLQQCQSILLSQYGDSLRGTEVSWEKRFIPEPGVPSREARIQVQLLSKWRNVTLLATSIIFNHLSRTNEYPIPFNNFQGIWTGICADAIQRGPDEYVESLCEIYLEIACISIEHAANEGEGTVINRDAITATWGESLSRLQSQDGQAAVEAAFETIEERDHARPRYLDRINYRRYDGGAPLDFITELRGAVTDMEQTA